MEVTADWEAMAAVLVILTFAAVGARTIAAYWSSTPELWTGRAGRLRARLAERRERRRARREICRSLRMLSVDGVADECAYAIWLDRDALFKDDER